MLIQSYTNFIILIIESLSSRKPKPIIFIVDRGFGVDSSVKGHRRYGGTLKEIIQGHNTHACITNESGTSQTCLYCFSPLTHPTYNKPYKGQMIKAQV
jgi:hypothetical protein